MREAFISSAPSVGIARRKAQNFKRWFFWLSSKPHLGLWKHFFEHCSPAPLSLSHLLIFRWIWEILYFIVCLYLSLLCPVTGRCWLLSGPNWLSSNSIRLFFLLSVVGNTRTFPEEIPLIVISCEISLWIRTQRGNNLNIAAYIRPRIPKRTDTNKSSDTMQPVKEKRKGGRPL